MLITLFFNFRNAKFAFDVRTYFAVRLNKLYISQPYNFHLNNNSSKIVNHLTQEVNLIAQGCNSVLMFITEFTVILGLVIFFHNLSTIHNVNFNCCNVTDLIYF